MLLPFKPTVWKAENRFVVATITKTDDDEAGFAWEIFSKVDMIDLTGGEEKSLADARRRCTETAITIAGAEISF